jgi:hypothetical protein
LAALEQPVAPVVQCPFGDSAKSQEQEVMAASGGGQPATRDRFGEMIEDCVKQILSRRLVAHACLRERGDGGGVTPPQHGYSTLRVVRAAPCQPHEVGIGHRVDVA